MKLMSLGMRLWVLVVDVAFGGRGEREPPGEKGGLPASSSSSRADIDEASLGVGGLLALGKVAPIKHA
jgi:hypothetical protein